VTGFNIFGDSIGLGVGVQTSSQVYAQIFANALGLPINNNFSVDGAHQAAFLTQATGVTPSVATGSITIVGANEIGESAAQPLYIPQYILSAQAFAVWLGLPPANVVQTSGMTFAGTWSDHPLFGIDGKFSGTPGSTATATVSGTTVYVTTFGGISGNFNQSYTVTIDSTVVLTETGFNTYVDSIPLCYRFSGLSAGSHTVVITATGTTPNYATISFIAGNSGTSFPLVVLGNTIQNASVGSDIPTITAMNTALATMVSNLDADGLDVLGVNDYPAITTTATPPEYAVDGVHPNQLGNQLLAQAFLDDMYAGNTAAGLTAQGLAALLQTALNKPPIVSTTTPTSHGFVGELALSSSAPWYFYVNVGVDTWDSVALQPFDTPYGTFGQQNSSAGVVTVAGDAGTNGGEVTFCGIGASPTCFPIQVATTGTTLNFGSNASLTAAGALTVVSCSGCGGGASSVSNSDGTLTISPTTGAVVASLALGHANTWTGTQTFGTITPTTISGGVSFSGTPVLSAGTLTCGVAGTAGCVVTGEGATSGSATLTWPAVAGTTSNPIVSSNYLSTPGLVSASSVGNLIIAPATNLLLEPANGDTVEISINGAGGTAAAPALTSAEGTTTGIWWPSAASIALSISGVEKSRQVANGFNVGPNAILGATTPGNTADTSLARGVAGRWDIGQSATITDTTGSIRLSSLQVAGTKFTASGCSNSTTVGGATAGSFASGTTGTCTVTITMGDSDTAPNGWSCTASDQTTPANLISQKTGGSTTTAVITGTTVSADVISFHCLAY
jgi:hypothetical protein